MASISDICYTHGMIDGGKSEKRGRGRPAMGVRSVMVRLPEDTIAEIDAVAGVGRRAEWIRRTVDSALRRDKIISDIAK